MFNQDIRQAAKEAGIMLWEIAEKYNGGISDCNFSRKLRRELSKDEKEKIRAIITDLSAKGVN